MNLAQKTSIHTDSRKLAVTGVSPDVIKLISDLNEDLTRYLLQKLDKYLLNITELPELNLGITFINHAVVSQDVFHK